MDRGAPGFGSGRNSKDRLVVTILVLLALVAGLWIGRRSAPGPDSPPVTTSPPRSGGERRLVNGVRLGYPRSQEGAVEAATNFTRVMASVSAAREDYVAAVETMAAPDWRMEARRLAENGLDFVQDRYGAGGSFSFAPVRYRVVSYTDSEATIDVWGVTVASGPKIPGIEESWLTGTLDLSWISGDWRLTGQQSETGPTPELVRTKDGVTADALSSFEEYEHAPSP